MPSSARRIRVVVVDDEATARAGVADLVSADPELELAATCSSGAEAVAAILDLEPDLVLLDVQMPRMDGFEVVRTVGADRMPFVVFITAFDQFALKAFEVFALDYVLKPFDDDRFGAAISRAKEAVRTAEAGRLGRRLLDLIGEVRPIDEQRDAPTGVDLIEPKQHAPLSRLVIKTGGRIMLLRVDEIDWIEAADYCVRVHSRGKAYMIRDSMTSLEARLNPSRFFRAHRSAIVNLDGIHEIQPSFRGEHVIILRDRTKVLLSRPRRARLEALLQQRL